MRRFVLTAAALAPLAAHGATLTIAAPGTPCATNGTRCAAGEWPSLQVLAGTNRSYLQHGGTAPIHPGDVIVLPNGPYDTNSDVELDDIGTPANPVTIESAGNGYTYLYSATSFGKGLFSFLSSNVVVRHMVFLGAKDGGSNISGIRLGVDYGRVDRTGHPYPYNLSVSYSGFFENDDGMLADDCSISPSLTGLYGHTRAGVVNTNGTCSIRLDHDTFSANGGPGGGLEHGIYIDRIDYLTVTNSLFADPIGNAHLIKSRAFNTDIENSRVIEGPVAQGNTIINIPVGGNLTVRGNYLEIGPGNNGQGFIDYQVECYMPWGNAANNPGQTIHITGNTVVDDWSPSTAAPPQYYTAVFLHDASAGTWQGCKGQTASPSGRPAALTLTGNHFYGRYWTGREPPAGWNPFLKIEGGSGAIDPRNTFAQRGAPAPDLTPTIPWPPRGTTTETLSLVANGYELHSANNTHNPASTNPADFPQFAAWWNGMLLTPKPSVVTADQTTNARQTFTYSVPVIPGIINFFEYQFLNGACCDRSGKGRSLDMINGALNGAPWIGPRGISFWQSDGDLAAWFAGPPG